jgi:hypothetical protein
VHLDFDDAITITLHISPSLKLNLPGLYPAFWNQEHREEIPNLRKALYRWQDWIEVSYR